MTIVTDTRYGDVNSVTIFTASNLNNLSDGAGVFSDTVDWSGYTHAFVEITFDTDRSASGSDARIDIYCVPFLTGGFGQPDPPGSTPLDVTLDRHVASIWSVKHNGTATNFTAGRSNDFRLPASTEETGVFVFVNELGVAFPANDNTVVRLVMFNLATNDLA